MQLETSVNETTQTEVDRRAFAEAFARSLAQQKIHDPDGKTSRRVSRTYTSYTRDNIENFLESPTASEKELRNASTFLYQTQSRYRNLLHYFACVPKWYYTITPVNFNPDRVKKETYRKQYQKTCNIIESMGLIRSMREAALVALREGAYYGVIWGGDGNSFIMQKLNPDYCQIVSITDGNVFQFAYDMSKIKKEDLSTYFPPQFADMYRAYEAGGSQYQVVPPSVGFCIKGDPSIPEYSIPPFSAVLPSLYSIKNIEDLTETAAELSNYKLIAGVLPVDAEGVPLIDYNTAMQYYSHIAGNVGDRVGVAISPFELKSYNFEQSGTTAQIDQVAKANANFFASAGTSALLHGATNTTSGVTKLAIKVDESFSFGIMNQCGAAINRFLKTLTGTVKFKVNFLPVSIFNESEMIDQYKSAMNYGMGKLQYAACIGIQQTDLMGQAFVENELIGFDDMFSPMRTAATRSANEAEGVGRPESGDEDLSDEGEATRDATANDNR